MQRDSSFDLTSVTMRSSYIIARFSDLVPLHINGNAGGQLSHPVLQKNLIDFALLLC